MSLPLKLMINKQKNKVIFAEANAEFVNVLLSFLALPLGKVEKNNIALGSINTLYRGLIDMDDSYFARGCKEMLVNPRSWLGDECRKLALDITYSPPKKYYVCHDQDCTEYADWNVSLYSDVAKCGCGKSLNKEILVAECREGVGFITNPSSFIVTDDLCVVPVLTGLFQTLSDLGITDTQGAVMMSTGFNIYMIRNLLNLSLTSATPLTDMMFKQTGTTAAAVKAEPGNPITLYHIPKEKLHDRKIVLKVLLQKSTSKFLYAEATDEFVNLLFSFLVVSLGGVESLLGGKTGFKNIDNLYRSVSSGIDDKCFRTPDSKSNLINPNLPYRCLSKKPFLPFGEGTCPKLFYSIKGNGSPVIKNTSFHPGDTGHSSICLFKSSKELYVKEHSKFIVTDDLTVTPVLATSILILNRLQISFSDVKEMELLIGVEEVLSLLKTSLTSKKALTDALINPMLNKLPELERKPKQEP